MRVAFQSGPFDSVVVVVSARITHTFSPRNVLLFLSSKGKRRRFADRYACNAELTRRISLVFHLVPSVRPPRSGFSFRRWMGALERPTKPLLDAPSCASCCNISVTSTKAERKREITHTHTRLYNKRMTRKEKSRPGLTNRYCRRSVWQKTDSGTH